MDNFILEPKSAEEARKLIDNACKKNSLIVVKGKDSSFNRKILENKKVSVLLSPENTPEKDSQKQRSSGLNQVLCKIAKSNNISIGIDLSEIRKREKKEKSAYLARIMQNIMLCKKYNVSMKAFNIKDKYNAKSLLLTLGMTTEMIKKAVE